MSDITVTLKKGKEKWNRYERMKPEGGSGHANFNIYILQVMARLILIIT